MKLLTPLVDVLMKDGTEFVGVQVLNPDILRYEKTARIHKWGPAQDSPPLWLTFVAWAALTREKQITMPWEDFSERECLQVAQSEQVSETVDPTNPAPEAG